MAFRSSPGASRWVALGLLAAGGVAGLTSTAGAQYYEPEDVYRRGYGYEGYGYEYVPQRAYPRPPRVINRVDPRDFGLVQVDRRLRTGGAYIVDGRTGAGTRVRLIFDSYSGELIDRIALAPPREAPRQPQRLVRIDPRTQDTPPPARIIPHPPERPPELKPPEQASAPATALPPSKVAPEPAEEPKRDRQGPASANAPATQPAPAPAPPSATADKPAAEAPPPAGTVEAAAPKADEPVISVPPVSLPPVQIDGVEKPQPEPPVVPAAPLD